MNKKGIDNTYEKHLVWCQMSYLNLVHLNVWMFVAYLNT